jgi:hypothetical protein
MKLHSKNVCFLKFWTINANNIFFQRKKSLPYQKVGDLIDVHCIIFSIFFCLVMFHDPQTWGPMAVENYNYILYVQ